MTKAPAARLCEFVLREYGRRLTPNQLRGPWTNVGSDKGETLGVIVPADGDHPGFRVMLVDFEGRAPGFTVDTPLPLDLT